MPLSQSIGQRPAWFVAWLLLGALLLALCGPGRAAAPLADEPDGAELEVFVRAGCPHCEEAEAFLARLSRERPALRITIRDVVSDAAALERLRTLAAQQGETALAVPSFYLRGELIVGYTGEAVTGARLRTLLDRPPAADASTAADARIVVPWLNIVLSADAMGLPLFTIVIGLLDGFNPCSMWVLIMMVSMLAAMGDRRKMLAIAGTFVVIEGIAYFAFMAAWLNLFLLIGISRASEVAIGVIALIAGLINVKDFRQFGRGVTLSIPSAAKPGIYARMRRVLHEQHMTVAIIGAIVLAVMVQFVELLCTSGFPMLYTRILTLHHLDPLAYYGYLLLYNAMYMLDDVIVLGIGVVTLSRYRLQEKEGRWLKLLAGVVMLLLGLYLLAVPH